MAALLGGHAITPTGLRWMSRTGLYVPFTSTYGSTRQHQLYAGRSLIGVTSTTSERAVRAVLPPSDYPQYLQLVAVLPAERLTDYGDQLPPRPYNCVQLTWTVSGLTDCRLFEVSSGTEPDGAVDITNVLGKISFDTNRAYTFRSRPLGPSGTWNFEVAGVDRTRPDGNRGTALELSAEVLTQPQDFVSDSLGRRFAVSMTGSTASVTWSNP